MALLPQDPYTYARPDLATVSHNILELFVDFDRKVLRGKIVITIIKKKELCDEIILDNYQLKIIKVTTFLSNDDLEYNIEAGGIFGSKFTIKLPHDKRACRVQIDYETSTNSPALYWLTPEQTSDGTHPSLISNTKLIYARAIFPCQDTPSVISTFFVTINVPMDFNVTVCGNEGKKTISWDKTLMKYTFPILKMIPSYAMVIVVGLLKNIKINSFCLWVEKKYLQQSINMCAIVAEILSSIERKFGIVDPKHSICVLPPNIPEFELQSSCMTLVSSTLLGKNRSLICIIIENILESWIANQIIIKNFEHLWLIKSLRTFFHREILRKTFGENLVKCLEKRGFNNMINTMHFCIPAMLFFEAALLLQIYDEVDAIPDLTNMLPNYIIKNVPYERGYMFLKYLEQLLDENGSFYSLLQNFIKSFQNSGYLNFSLRTHLFNGLPDKIDVLNSVSWSKWLDEPIFELNLSSYSEITIDCHILAEQWITAPINELHATVSQVANYHDLEKIEFLAYLCASVVTLPKFKLDKLRLAFLNDQEICEIRFHWLRLCIKCKSSLEMARHALNFACEYSMPKYACPIFSDLFEWSETRHLVISTFVDKHVKMLPETIRELESILNCKI